MPQDLRVRLARQVKVRFRKNFVTQFLVVSQLAVKAECEPLRFLDVVPFERLGVAAVIFSAGRVPHMADGGRPGILLHHGFGLLLMVQTEDLADGTDILMGIDQLAASGMKRRHPRSELSPVLQVEQQPRDQPGRLPRPLPGCQLADIPMRKMINRCNAAFMKEFRHSRSFE